jgi:hypothetical protein
MNKERRDQTKKVKKEVWTGILREIKMNCCTVNAWELRKHLMKRTLVCRIRHFFITEPILVCMLFPGDHYYVTSADWAYETGKSRTLLNALTRVRPWHFFSRILELLSYIRWRQEAMFILRRLRLWKLNRRITARGVTGIRKSSTLTTEQEEQAGMRRRLRRHITCHILWFKTLSVSEII